MSEALITLADSGETLELGNFKLSKTGLVVRGKPSFDEWERCGAILKRIEGAVQWWIGDWLNYGEKAYGEKYAQALDETGLAYQTLDNYAYVARNVQLSLRRDDVAYSVHKEIASLPTDQQKAILDQAGAEQMTVAEVRKEIRLTKRREHYAAGPLPEGPFRVVYADPPWAYDDSGVIVGSDAYGRAERHYPTMTVEELAALPVRERIEEHAVLFLWVTSPLLAECWPVIEAWGFEYKTSLVWDKVAHNFGHYVSVRHEFLLLCTRGSCTPDAPTPMPDSVIVERRSEEHSEKPACVRQLIDRLYPLGARVELFGRNPVEGWTVYGNQLLPAETR